MCWEGGKRGGGGGYLKGVQVKVSVQHLQGDGDLKQLHVYVESKQAGVLSQGHLQHGLLWAILQLELPLGLVALWLQGGFCVSL